MVKKTEEKEVKKETKKESKDKYIEGTKMKIVGKDLNGFEIIEEDLQ